MNYTERQRRTLLALGALVAAITIGLGYMVGTNGTRTPGAAPPTTSPNTPSTTSGVEIPPPMSPPATTPATPPAEPPTPAPVADPTLPPATTAQDGPPPDCPRVWAAGLHTPPPGYTCTDRTGTPYTVLGTTCTDGTILITGQPEPDGPIFQGTDGLYLDTVTPEAAVERVGRCQP